MAESVATMLVMEFQIRVVADGQVDEADLARALKQTETLRKGFIMTALAILPEGVKWDVTIIDEPSQG